jgi:hypothetical protein
MAENARVISHRLNGGEFFDDSGLYLACFTVVIINKG